MNRSFLRIIAICGVLTLLMAGVPATAVVAQVKQKQVKPAVKPPAITAEENLTARLQLSELGYFIDLNAKGNDASLKHALYAFQKIEGRPRTGVLTREEMAEIAVAKAPQPIETGYTHIEIDLCKQVLFVFDAVAGTTKVMHVSTGSGECFTEGGRTRRAITPTGRYKIVRKISGWRKSPLGLLYYPSYFFDGVAIHGNPAVPPRPASHGCVRIPMFAAKEFFEFAVLEMPVYIYDSSPTPSPPPKPCA